MRSLLLIGLAALLASNAAAADTVKLKSGQVIRGKVTDRGAYVIVEKDLGAAPAAATATASAAVRIERDEILTIDLDGATARPPQDLDVVVFVNGDELAGRVEIREGGKEIVIVGEGDRGELKFDGRQVRTVLWSQKAQAEQRAAGAGIGMKIQRSLDELRAPDEPTRRAARERLHGLGVYALPYLEARGADPDPVVAGAVRDVLEVARLRTFMTPSLVERVPGLARAIVEAQPATRVAALKEAVVADPKGCAPILVYLAKTDRSKEVRAFALGQLTLLDCTRELLELLDSRDGGLRFAAAVALGDNGVLVGVPLLVEGLKHEELPIRKLSIQKLEAWTGHFLGYFPDASAAERAAAVAKWEAWWAKTGAELTTRSIRSTIKRDEITDDEKTQGLAHWTNAQLYWDKAAGSGLEGDERRRQMHRVRFLLGKSLELYPQNVNARIALAVLWYTELGEPEPARRELDLVLHRYDAEGAPRSRLLAHFHLGRIAQTEGRYGDASTHYRLALSIDGRNVDALRADAKNAYDRAAGEERIAVAERRKYFETAASQFTAALEEVDRYELDLKDNAERAADGIALAQPFRRGGFLKSVDLVKLEMRRTAADIRFLRGRTYLAMQKPREAEVDFQAALDLDPENPLFQQAVKRQWAPPRPAEAPKQAATTPTATPK